MAASRVGTTATDGGVVSTGRLDAGVAVDGADDVELGVLELGAFGTALAGSSASTTADGPEAGGPVVVAVTTHWRERAPAGPPLASQSYPA